ncbi:MAG TPA: TetR family transcriptional regulator [Acidimicrobiales bacterium]|nr:TetR family transcriptional regulator [Acidimicrobiales bacterium]
MLATERRLEAAIHEAEDTKDQLLRAGEYLFARQGIDGTKIGEINELAGQRNPSAVHYHFGSKQGLVVAILRRHQEALEVEVGRCLDGLQRRDSPAPVREMVEAMVRPLAAELDSASGRDFLRIVPQFIAPLDANLRRGVAEPVTTQSRRLLGLLEDRMTHLPQAIRRERLVTYTLVLTSLLADRARHLEDRQPTALDAGQFVVHLLDVIEAVITAPSSV